MGVVHGAIHRALFKGPIGEGRGWGGGQVESLRFLGLFLLAPGPSQGPGGGQAPLGDDVPYWRL